jgi:hypothetical protein
MKKPITLHHIHEIRGASLHSSKLTKNPATNPATNHLLAMFRLSTPMRKTASKEPLTRDPILFRFLKILSLTPLHLSGYGNSYDTRWYKLSGLFILLLRSNLTFSEFPLQIITGHNAFSLSVLMQDLLNEIDIN